MTELCVTELYVHMCVCVNESIAYYNVVCVCVTELFV